MTGSDPDDVRIDPDIDVPVDGTVRFDASLRCRGLDDGGAAVLGVDPQRADSGDPIARLSRSPAETRATLSMVVEAGRPTTIEWDARATELSGWGWAVPADGGVSVLLVVDDRGTEATELEQATGDAADATTTGSPAETAETLLAHTETLAGTGGWEYDIGSGTLTWTSGTRRVHGVAPDFDPTVERALLFYHPNDRGTIRELLTRAIEARESYDTEARIHTSNGERRWIRTVGEPVERDGEAVAVRGAIQDITESREQKRQIALLRRAIDAAPVGVTLVDMRRDDQPMVYLNEAFEELTGYSEAESLGRNCRFLQGEETDPETVADIRAAIEADESTTVTIRNYRADGTPFWNRLTIAPVTGPDGTVTHYVGFQIDVTEQKDAESRLREFEGAVEHSGHAIYITDVDGTISYVNPSFEALTGYEYNEAVGETPNILNSGQMEDEYFKRLWTTITAGETFEERTIDKDRDGHQYRAHQTIAPLTDTGGEVTGFVAVQTNITDQIERTQQVAVLDRVLRHNLRNDMNVILGHAERLRGELEDDLADSASTIASTGHDLLELVDKERTVVEQLSAPDTIRPHGVRSLVESVAIDAREEYPNAEIGVDCPAGGEVDATPQIADALGEVMENAIVHTDESTPSVDIGVRTATHGAETTGDADTVRVSIADRGPGIPQSDRDLIVRDHVPDALTHTDGIGLWLASWIVSRSGGSISFEDRDGGGTVVHVDLPQAT